MEKLKNVDKNTRAGKNGKIIQCPKCNHKSVIFHFGDMACSCSKCQEMIDKCDWLYDPQRIRGEVFKAVKTDSKEWDYMWAELALMGHNKNIPDPKIALNKESLEAWQYLGTYNASNGLYHEFRHRDHPMLPKDLKDKSMCYRVAVSDTFSDKDCEKLT